MPRIVFALALVGLASMVTAIPNVMLFYEALCGDCRVEMSTSLPDALNKFGNNVFFSLVPYGNTENVFEKNGTIKYFCQHGKDECVANTWHACSHLYMTARQQLEYAICTMSGNVHDTISRLKTCTTPNKAKLLAACAESSIGAGAIKLMADITTTAGAVWDNTTRQLYGVPTVFIDGFPINFNDTSKYTLSQLICLKALEKPINC